MATYSIEKLSHSTDGLGIKVAGVNAAADTDIHTATANAGDIDLVTLYAVNQDTVSRDLTLGWGGETAVDNEITTTIAAKGGLVMVADRLPIMNGLIIVAWASVVDVIVIYGIVERVDK